MYSRATLEPIGFGGSEITEILEAFKAGNGTGGWRQAKHPEGLFQGMVQTHLAEVIGTDKAVAVAAEHPNARSHAKGRADAGNGVLLS